MRGKERSPFNATSMSSDDTSANLNEAQELQFDRVETTHPSGDPATSPSVTCVVCGRSVGAEYYTANGKPVCASCRDVVTSATATPRSPGPLLLAGLFGLGAAVAGAAIYYAVIAIANLEIGIVAILIGYMVGWAVRKGAGGRGGRRFQILAVALTYWAVGLAYTPLAFKQMVGDKKGTSASTLTTDSTGTVGPTIGERVGDSTQAAANAADSTTRTAPADEAVTASDVLKTIGALALLVFALPVLSVFGSLPFGLISALIIFIGMRQAWQMTAAPQLAISGPFRVGTGPASASG
jgi:hypothetical protein